ncbi:MAG: hypothetical protein QW290_09540 [Sulfolobales archaeon]
MKEDKIVRRVRKTATIPRDLVEWVDNGIRNSEHPGICSLSGLIEYLVRNEREEKKVK